MLRTWGTVLAVLLVQLMVLACMYFVVSRIGSSSPPSTITICTLDGRVVPCQQ